MGGYDDGVNEFRGESIRKLEPGVNMQIIVAVIARPGKWKFPSFARPRRKFPAPHRTLTPPNGMRRTDADGLTMHSMFTAAAASTATEGSAGARFPRLRFRLPSPPTPNNFLHGGGFSLASLNLRRFA